MGGWVVFGGGRGRRVVGGRGVLGGGRGGKLGGGCKFGGGGKRAEWYWMERRGWNGIAWQGGLDGRR